MRFKKIENEIICTFKMSADGPVIVATGSSNRISPEKTDTCFLMSNDNGKPVYVIPGSSIKGAIRSYVEERFCFDEEKIKKLFGDAKPNRSIKGKISFYDAFADMDTIKTDIRYNTAISPIGQGVKTGSLNCIEAVTAGNFSTGFTMKNADDREFHYIIKALNGLNEGEICIGGRKSRGFGNMKIKDFKLTVTNGFDNELKPVIVGEYKDINVLLCDIEKGKLSLYSEEHYV